MDDQPPLTLLLVDDSETDRAIYQQFLTRNQSSLELGLKAHKSENPSYHLVAFDTGEAALGWCRQQVADLVLLNSQLLDMEGLEFLRQLRQQSPYADVPLVMITEQEDIAITALQQGAQDYLNKNWLSADLLEQVIHRALKQVHISQEMVWQQEQQRLVAALRESETRLQQLNQQLEDRVLERTAELQEVQDRLQFIVSSSPGVVYTCRAYGDFGTTFMMGNVTALFGYEASDYTENPTFWIDRISPKDKPRILAELQNLYQQEFYNHEYRFLHQDGTYCWVYDQWKVIPDEQGKPAEIIGYWADISDRKRFEAEILQNRDLREAIFNESTDAIFLVDSITLLTLDCNRRAVELFEASSAAELINIEGHILQRQQFSETDLQSIQQEINLKGYWSREIEYITKTGRCFWGNIAAKAIQVAGRQLNLVRVTDISDQQAARQEQERAERQIKASLQEKEVLLKEIHHRVKNNMQIITSLLNLQAGYIQDHQAQTIFKESQSRVRAMALVHEKLYQSSDLARTDFSSYIRTLSMELMRSYNINPCTVQLITRIEAVYLGIDLAIPCGLILNELISNALKYAFPNRQGEIQVQCRTTTPERYELVVQDNGIGLPANLDFQNTTSLGLQLVSMLTQQLGGEIVLNRNQGTRFTITFSATP